MRSDYDARRARQRGLREAAWLVTAPLTLWVPPPDQDRAGRVGVQALNCGHDHAIPDVEGSRCSTSCPCDRVEEADVSDEAPAPVAAQIDLEDCEDGCTDCSCGAVALVAVVEAAPEVAAGPRMSQRGLSPPADIAERPPHEIFTPPRA